jgi:hypothetical protein
MQIKSTKRNGSFSMADEMAGNRPDGLQPFGQILRIPDGGGEKE